MSIDELLSRLHGGGIVWVIAQKIGDPYKTMTIDTEDTRTDKHSTKCYIMLVFKFVAICMKRWAVFSAHPNSRPAGRPVRSGGLRHETAVAIDPVLEHAGCDYLRRACDHVTPKLVSNNPNVRCGL